MAQILDLQSMTIDRAPGAEPNSVASWWECCSNGSLFNCC
ncbi:SapB/AmfS family lanthipeptide [Actinomadura flavalba]|nr:SapB/AmfS family lanthipeptide [Actinomadura flavalba]